MHQPIHPASFISLANQLASTVCPFNHYSPSIPLFASVSILLSQNVTNSQKCIVNITFYTKKKWLRHRTHLSSVPTICRLLFCVVLTQMGRNIICFRVNHSQADLSFVWKRTTLWLFCVKRYNVCWLWMTEVDRCICCLNPTQLRDITTFCVKKMNNSKSSK